jgi:hypothetical protein
MRNHLLFYNKDEDKAFAIQQLFYILMKLNVGIETVQFSQDWAGDISISVEYKLQVLR